MASTRLPEFPTDGGQDKALDFLIRLLKASSGSVPVLGPYLSETIEFCYIRPIEKRRTEWFQELECAFRELSQKVDGLTPAKLGQDPEFITVLHRATDIALRTHQSEKRRLLRNAIVTAGSPIPPEQDKQVFFLRLVDMLSINQVLVILLYSDPVGWFKQRNIRPNNFHAAARIEVLNQAYPNISKDPEFKQIVLGDLERLGSCLDSQVWFPVAPFMIQ